MPHVGVPVDVRRTGRYDGPIGISADGVKIMFECRLFAYARRKNHPVAPRESLSSWRGPVRLSRCRIDDVRGVTRRPAGARPHPMSERLPTVARRPVGSRAAKAQPMPLVRGLRLGRVITFDRVAGTTSRNAGIPRRSLRTKESVRCPPAPFVESVSKSCAPRSSPPTRPSAPCVGARLDSSTNPPRIDWLANWTWFQGRCGISYGLPSRSPQARHRLSSWNPRLARASVRRFPKDAARHEVVVPAR